MDGMFWTATAVMLVFIIFRLAEGKLSSKEERPIKDIVKDSVIVYLSALGALFIMKQIAGSSSSSSVTQPKVSTDAPFF